VCNAEVPQPADIVGQWDECEWFWCDMPPGVRRRFVKPGERASDGLVSPARGFCDSCGDAGAPERELG